jgi:hexosaminidase
MNHRLRRPAVLSLWSAGLAALVIGVPASVFAVTASAAPARPASTAAATAAATPGIVPEPVSAKIGSGHFTLTRRARIVAAPGAHAAAELAIAADLAAYLRPATGYPLPTVTGALRPGDIAITIGHLTKPRPEEYQLVTNTVGAGIQAPTAHGLYDGIQTFRQLFPAWINSRRVMPGPWTAPVVSITDHPRYPYRGLLLDLARHYEYPSAVKKLISQSYA